MFFMLIITNHLYKLRIARKSIKRAKRAKRAAPASRLRSHRQSHIPHNGLDFFGSTFTAMAMISPLPNTLLGLPPELRLVIYEYVAAQSSYCKYLTFGNNNIGPVPSIMNVCTKLRKEFGWMYFRNKTVWMSTFGELGTALLLARSTVSWTRILVSLKVEKNQMLSFPQRVIST